MMPTQEEAGAMAVSLAELKAYLRITTGDEDAVLAGLLRAATSLCEQFVGQWLMEREAREMVMVDRGWHRLAARPVTAIVEVAGLRDDGSVEALPPQAYAIDIDGNGEGWVRSVDGTAGRLLCVRYRAGMAQEMNALPEAIRQGIVRLAADHHGARGSETAAPPAVVGALWRPWRRMRLA